MFYKISQETRIYGIFHDTILRDSVYANGDADAQWTISTPKTYSKPIPYSNPNPYPKPNQFMENAQYVSFRT